MRNVYMYTFYFSNNITISLYTYFPYDFNHQLCAPELKLKLGGTVPAYKGLGAISPYFVDRFGFDESAQIIPFTGDNPGTIPFFHHLN